MNTHYYTNREKILEERSEYYEKNKEKILERSRKYFKEYYEKNKPKILELAKEYREKQKEEINEELKRFRLDRHKVYQKTYRAKTNKLSYQQIMGNYETKSTKKKVNIDEEKVSKKFISLREGMTMNNKELEADHKPIVNISRSLVIDFDE